MSRSDVDHETTDPRISVVVATHNRAELLPRLVRALGPSQGIDHEIIIVDDASSDSTPSVLEGLSQRSTVPMRWRRQPRNRGPAAARNIGWQDASAPLVAFTDDDCVPQTGWLKALAAALDRADVVQGRTKPDPEQAQRHGPFSRTLDVESESGFYQTCNMGYRRTVLESLGGFDERFSHPMGEDTDLAWRAREHGFSTCFVSDALVHHDVRPSSFIVQLRDIWRWQRVPLVLRLHPQLRLNCHRWLFWKSTHPPALLAAAGLGVVVGRGGTRATRLLGVLLVSRYVRFRWRRVPMRGSRVQRLVALPFALIIDLSEVAVMTIGSLKYRSPVL